MSAHDDWVLCFFVNVGGEGLGRKNNLLHIHIILPYFSV